MVTSAMTATCMTTIGHVTQTVLSPPSDVNPLVMSPYGAASGFAGMPPSWPYMCNPFFPFMAMNPVQTQQAASMLGAAGTSQQVIGFNETQTQRVGEDETHREGQTLREGENESRRAGEQEHNLSLPGPSNYLLVQDRPVFQRPTGAGAKRPRYFEVDSDDDDSEELEAERFDPGTYYRSKKLKLPRSIEKYLDFRSYLATDVRKAMSADKPLPHLPALTAPEADDVINYFMGFNFPAKMDTQLKRVQSATIVASAPILNLWSQMEDQPLIRVAWYQLIESFQKTLVLLVQLHVQDTEGYGHPKDGPNEEGPRPNSEECLQKEQA